MLFFFAKTTVVDACAALREKLTEIKGLGPAAQYGLFLADEDPKKGTQPLSDIQNCNNNSTHFFFFFCLDKISNLILNLTFVDGRV